MKRIILTLILILCIFTNSSTAITRIATNPIVTFKQYFNTLDEALIAAEQHQNKPSKKLLTSVCYLEYTFNGTPKITLLKNISYKKDLLLLKNITLDLKKYTLTVQHQIEAIDSFLISTELKKNGKIILLDTNASESDELNSIHLVNSTLQKIDIAVDSSTHANYRLISIDGSCNIDQCNFTLTGSFGDKVRPVFVNDGQYLVIENTSIVANISLTSSFIGVFCYGNASVRNCDIDISVYPLDTNVKLAAYGCYCRSTEFGEVIDSTIYVKNYAYIGRAYAIYASGLLETLNIQGGTYIADSHYLSAASDSYEILSIGILTYARYNFVDDAFVHGNHSGMQISKEGYITRSTFESTGHGGIYFTHSADLEGRNYVYVNDSELRHCPASGIFEEDVSNPNYSSDNRAAFYIGGSATSCYISVLMDNCIIEGDKYSAVLRGSSKEHDNELSISNSQIKAPIRKDSAELTLNIGVNTNITEDSTLYFKRKLTTYKECGDSTIHFTENTYRIIPNFLDKKPFTFDQAEMR